MDEFLSLLRKSSDKISTVYASVLQSKSIADSLFQGLVTASSSITPSMLATILKYPLSYPLTDIDMLFCECISALVAQDACRAELVFVTLLSFEDVGATGSTPFSCKHAKVDVIKHILSANPTAINALAAAIQATIPSIHCIKRAIPWLDLILLLETSISGLVHSTVEAAIKLLLLIDSHIEAFSVPGGGADVQPTAPPEVAPSEGGAVGSYISPSFGSHKKFTGPNPGKQVAYEEPQEHSEEDAVEGCFLEDAESIDFCTDIVDQLLVSYFEHLRALWSSDSGGYVKRCQSAIIPCFARLGMCLRTIRYTQFIVFYAVSLDPSLPGLLIEYLIKRSLFDLSASISTYLDSMNYLGSFIARFSGLTLPLMIGSIKLLLQYATHLGAELDPENIHALDRAIGVYRIAGELCLDMAQRGFAYKGKAQVSTNLVPGGVIRYLSVVRTLLYALCFVAEDIAPQDLDMGALSRLLLSDLCPIVYFYDIGVQLLHVIHKWAFLVPSELDKLHAILDYAQNVDLPYNVISCFYPFEPLCLPRSSNLIAPYYRDYWVQEADDTVA